MPKYRKSPVVVDAWHVGEHFLPDDALVRLKGTQKQVYDALHFTWVNYEAGDWIIRGVRGEFYPCKRDVFTLTYEPV